MARDPGPPGSRPSVRDRIAGTVGEHSLARRQVARYLLDGYPLAGLASLKTIGDASHASGATVLRYIQSLGYPSHKDFQAALRAEAHLERQREPLTFGADEAPTLAGPLMHSVEATFGELLAGPLDTIVELLAQQHRRVFCRGGPFSFVLAEFLWAHLKVLRPNVFLTPLAQPEVADALDLRRSDIIVLFDYRPYTPSSLAYARAVANRKALLVVFTDPGLSPLADVASQVYITRVKGVGTFESFAPAIAALELILTALEARLGDSVRHRYLKRQALREAAAGEAFGSAASRAPQRHAP